MALRRIDLEHDFCDLVFEACVEYELELKRILNKKQNFVNGLIGGHPDIAATKKQIADLEKKIERLRSGKYRFGYQQEFH